MDVAGASWFKSAAPSLRLPADVETPWAFILGIILIVLGAFSLFLALTGSATAMCDGSLFSLACFLLTVAAPVACLTCGILLFQGSKHKSSEQLLPLLSILSVGPIACVIGSVGMLVIFITRESMGEASRPPGATSAAIPPHPQPMTASQTEWVERWQEMVRGPRPPPYTAFPSEAELSAAAARRQGSGGDEAGQQP